MTTNVFSFSSYLALHSCVTCSPITDPDSSWFSGIMLDHFEKAWMSRKRFTAEITLDKQIFKEALKGND